VLNDLFSLDLAPSRWRKSSYSDNTGADCIELAALTAAEWRKSSHSTNTGADCVELASASGARAVRDSKNTPGPALIFDTTKFDAFLTHVGAGQR
jgi:hypothetical protein